MKSFNLSVNSEAIPDFTTVLVHEFRNPLTTIKLSVGMMAKKVKDDDIKKYLDIISRSTERIDDLIIDLLKPPQEDIDAIGACSIDQLLDEVIQMTDDRIRLSGVEVSRAYEIRDIKSSLNKAQVKIALTNIIVNAIDAMIPQQGKLKLGTKSTHSKYIMQIEDNGCGIKPENLGNIFKPYFTDKADGLGLGLTATQNILRSNDIACDVTSEVGIGTRFTLLFSKLE